MEVPKIIAKLIAEYDCSHNNMAEEETLQAQLLFKIGLLKALDEINKGIYELNITLGQIAGTIQK